MPEIKNELAKEREDLVVYKRNHDTLARSQAIPGQVGLEHGIGGLEVSEDGGVSYDPENHENMTHLRSDKIDGIAKSYLPIQVQDKKVGDLLVIGRGYLRCYFIRD